MAVDETKESEINIFAEFDESPSSNNAISEKPPVSIDEIDFEKKIEIDDNNVLSNKDFKQLPPLTNQTLKVDNKRKLDEGYHSDLKNKSEKNKKDVSVKTKSELKDNKSETKITSFLVKKQNRDAEKADSFFSHRVEKSDAKTSTVEISTSKETKKYTLESLTIENDKKMKFKREEKIDKKEDKKEPKKQDEQKEEIESYSFVM